MATLPRILQEQSVLKSSSSTSRTHIFYPCLYFFTIVLLRKRPIQIIMSLEIPLKKPECAQDWEDIYEEFRALWPNRTLPEIMGIMEAEHRFRAT